MQENAEQYNNVFQVKSKIIKRDKTHDSKVSRYILSYI